MKQALSLIILVSLYFHVSMAKEKHNLILPTIFSDGMVLQRNVPIPFWGTCNPGQNVSVSINNKTEYTTADENGAWILRLPPMKAGGPYWVAIAAGDNIMLKDVWVGDVWIASGQSNMEMPIAPNQYFTGIKNYEAEISNANDSLLRVFTVKKNSAIEKPQRQVIGQWQRSNPINAGIFSAVAYFFGENLRENLNIPIGIIHTSWGASPAQAWTSSNVLSGDPDFQKLVDDWKELDKEHQLKVVAFKKDSALWEEFVQLADSGKPIPDKPKRPGYPILLQKRPSSLYNGMIYPLIPYGIKGVVWYQAEGNGDNPKLYEKLFPAMISNWRNDWGQGDFPFLFVQIAGFKKKQQEPVENKSRAELREAQLRALKLANTGVITAIDLGEESDIHPQNKQDVGYRLAQCALSLAYKQKAFYSGPTYNKMKIKGNKIHLYFNNTDGGMLALDSDTLKGFAIAGENREFVWAEATIQRNKVIVYSDSINKPVAVRYAWANNPIGNLYNKKGLPAMPFRTDDWE